MSNKNRIELIKVLKGSNEINECNDNINVQLEVKLKIEMGDDMIEIKKTMVECNDNKLCDGAKLEYSK